MPVVSLFGRNYNMVLMPDGQYWTDENLAALNYGSGDTATFYNGSTTDDGGGCFYSYYQASIDIDSYLPAGFRVAKYADWNTLISACGPTAGIGNRFRVPGTTWWRAPNTGAADAYGFKALGAGRRSNAGSWENRLDAAHIWAPATGNSPQYRFAYIFANSPDFVQIWGGAASERLSVRIIGTASPSGFSGVFPAQSGAWRNASEGHVAHGSPRIWRKASQIFRAEGTVDPGTPGTASILGTTYPTVIMPDGNEWMAVNLAWTDVGVWWNFAGTDDGDGRYYNLYGTESPSTGVGATEPAAVKAALVGTGWRIPTQADALALDAACAAIVGAANVGGALKVTDEWAAPNTGALNQFGFNSRPTGRHYVSTWEFKDTYGWFGLDAVSPVRTAATLYNSADFLPDVDQSAGGIGVSFRVPYRLVRAVPGGVRRWREVTK